MERERESTQDEPGLITKLVDKARGSGVGTEDPNIVGDAGPTDVPPGRDPDSPAWPVSPDGEVEQPIDDPEPLPS